jgi:hypothetical protein
MQAPAFQPDEAVGVGEAAELDAHLRHRGARFQFAKHSRADFFRRFEKQAALKALHHPTG